MRFLVATYGTVIISTVVAGLVFMVFPLSFNQKVMYASFPPGPQKQLTNSHDNLYSVSTQSTLILKLNEAANKKNDAEAQFQMGVIYENGLEGVEINSDEAARWYSKAITKGHSGAKYKLGMMQKSAGGLLAQDAYRLFRSASFQGHSLAMLEQAKAFDKGVGTQANALKAAYWYMKAASLGVPDAHLGLAELYLSGRGYSKDLNRAIEHLTLASEGGVAEAQYKLGMIYFAGIGIAADPVRADHWLREALRQGYIAAKLPLSRIMLA